MVKLYDSGVYLVNGRRLASGAEEAAALAREEQLKVRLVRLQDELARIEKAYSEIF